MRGKAPACHPEDMGLNPEWYCKILLHAIAAAVIRKARKFYFSEVKW